MTTRGHSPLAAEPRKHYARYVPEKHRPLCPICSSDWIITYQLESTLMEHICSSHPEHRHQCAYVASCAFRDKLLEVGPIARLGPIPIVDNPESLTLESATSELKALISANRNLREYVLLPRTCYGCLKCFKYEGFYEKHLRVCERANRFRRDNLRVSQLRAIIEASGYSEHMYISQETAPILKDV